MRFLWPRAVVAPLALLLMAAGALGQGVVDIEHDPESATGYGCGTDIILNGTILQEFVPSKDTLIAVELRLQAGDAFPDDGYTTTARIRAGSSTGTVLVEATADVAGPMSVGEQVIVRFDFDTLSVTPGDKYLIEWVTPSTSILTWVGKTDTGGGYADGGMCSCSGNPWPIADTDLNFITYAEEEVVEEAPTSEEPTSEEPTTEPSCEDLLAELHAAVDELGLSRRAFKKFDGILDKAGRYMEKDKERSARAMLKAFDGLVRVYARFGVIADEDAEALLDLSGRLQECLGGSLKDWSGKDKHGHDKSRHDDDDDDDRNGCWSKKGRD
jgi:hypothetical protein